MYNIFSLYLNNNTFAESLTSRYNDIEVVHDPAVYRRLREGGIDHPLAIHVAHLFIRDTVSLFSEKVHQDDENDTDHFEVRPMPCLL